MEEKYMNNIQKKDWEVIAYKRKISEQGSMQRPQGQRKQRTGSVQGRSKRKKQQMERLQGEKVRCRQQIARGQLREARKKKRRRQVFIARFVCAFFICVIAGMIVLGVHSLGAKEKEIELESFAQTIAVPFHKENDWTIEDIFGILEKDGIVCTQDFLTLNDYSRPGNKLKEVKNIFVHYTANPGTNAAQNRSYFENLSETHETSASSHFIIGYEGEIVQCVPLDEIAYAVAGRNNDSISIECCYVDENGEFTEETYRSLVHFSALLLEKYGLKSKDLMRHYDDNGKICPKYYVENEDAWWQFVEDVKVYQESLSTS